MNKTSSRVRIAALALLGWFLSGAIHEVGHALTAKMAGLQILHLQPWALFGRAHGRLAGETTQAWFAAVSISGMLFTVLIGVTGALLTGLAARKSPALQHTV